MPSIFENHVGETGVGWGKFWLGQCPSVPNELPDGETNYVFGEQMTTAFTGARGLHALLTGEYKPWTKHGRNMDAPWINGSSREFTVSITSGAYRAELILGR